MQSRLSRTTERKTKKQLAFSVLGIIVILFLLYKFGIPALTGFSLFVTSLRGDSGPTQQNAKSVILAPSLIEAFQATNSATITVNGTGIAKQTIQLFVNDDLVDTTTVKSDNTFTFSDISLTQQQNAIKARAKQDGKVSDYSDTWNISFLQKAPSLSLDSPSDGQSFPHEQDSVLVKGKTDSDVRVTVNDFWAITDSSGNYSYNLKLQNGDNHIKVVATDAAGNTTSKEVTVKYSQ
jgi:bacillopeptidase F